ncbi:MAG TPA: TonB-dependent receptor [Bryobacteraceae bacterium]|nr:TonB-dependent receptor [Bryobacteraceae bacterium]
MRLVRPISKLALAVTFAWQLAAQSMGTGTITGTVSDPSGSAVPAVNVTALHLGTRTTRSAVTNDSGNYVLTNMPIGEYEITAELSGFKKVVQQGVHLNADTTATVNMQLQIGAMQESVTVSSALPALQTENGEVSNLVSGVQVSELSLNGRNFSQFITLSPGVASSQTGRRMGVGQEGNPLTSINGGRVNSTKFTYDGVLAMDTGGNRGLNLFPPMEALAEVQVKTSNYSADEGSYGYGLVNVVTKAGGSEFHGALYEVFGNTNLDARNFFDSRRAPFHQNMFGFTLGGPIYIPNHYNKDKNKTFFFVSEGWNLRQGPQVVNYTSPPQSTFTATTITAAQRAGIFGAAIKDPTTGLNFTNNVVPTSRIDPNAAALLRLYYPLPNSTGASNYVFSPNSASRWREDLVRVDQQLSEKFLLTLRYAHDNWHENENIFAPSNANFPTQPGFLGKPGYNAILRLTWTINPTTTNVFTDGYSRNEIMTYPTGAAASRSGVNIPEVLPGNLFNAPPDITITGFSNIGVGAPNPNANNVFEWKDDLSHVVGNHTLQAGFDIMRLQKFDRGAVNTQGAFTFNGNFTGNAAADFLLGDAFSYTESSLNPNGYFFSNSYEMYFQDDWKVTPHLTLNLGLRWTMFKAAPIGYEKYNNISGFSPQLYDPTQAPALLATGQIVNGTGNLLNGIYTPNNLQGQDLPRSLLKGRYNMPGPRFGFAWSPGNNSKTVVRGGYGIFYHWDNNNSENYRNNPPFTSSVSIFNTSLSNPAGGTARVFPPNLQAFDAQNYYPSVQQWSFGLQWEIPGGFVLSATYVGNHAAHLDQQPNLNQPAPNLPVALGTVNVNTVRPYQGYGTITYDERNASAAYHALQTVASRRYANGFFLQASYTWSKSIVWGFGQDPFAQPNEEGLNSFDQPHNFTFSYVYTLPFFQGRSGLVKAALGGWETSGNATFASGFPVTVTVSADRAGTGSTLQRPNVTGPLNITGNVFGYFNPSAFALEPLGTYGNEGSNIVRGPGISNAITFNLFRNFRLTETSRLRIGGEFFNIFNHANFSSIGTVYGSATFGNVTAALDPRHVQLSAKLVF